MQSAHREKGWRVRPSALLARRSESSALNEERFGPLWSSILKRFALLGRLNLTRTLVPSRALVGNFELIPPDQWLFATHGDVMDAKADALDRADW